MANMLKKKCCGGVYNGFKGCVSDHFRSWEKQKNGKWKLDKKDGVVIFKHLGTGRYYCATCLFQEPEFDGYPTCIGIKQTVYKYD